MRSSILALFTGLLCAPAWAATVTISNGTELHVGVGDYAAVAGYAYTSSNAGQVVDVIDTKYASASNSVLMGDLYDLLAGDGLTSTSTLVFGFSANEKQVGGQDAAVTITQLDMSFGRSGQAASVFSLTPDNIIVVDFNGGNSLAEAQVQVNLDFDFMAEYSSASTELFQITASFSGNTNGSDRLFLSTGFTSSPLVPVESATVPLPGAMWLFVFAASGLVGTFRRRTA